MIVSIVSRKMVFNYVILIAKALFISNIIFDLIINPVTLFVLKYLQLEQESLLGYLWAYQATFFVGIYLGISKSRYKFSVGLIAGALYPVIKDLLAGILFSHLHDLSCFEYVIRVAKYAFICALVASLSSYVASKRRLSRGTEARRICH
jgi:hypothetical protein